MHKPIDTIQDMIDRIHYLEAELLAKNETLKFIESLIIDYTKSNPSPVLLDLLTSILNTLRTPNEPISD